MYSARKPRLDHPGSIKPQLTNRLIEVIQRLRLSNADDLELDQLLQELTPHLPGESIPPPLPESST